MFSLFLYILPLIAHSLRIDGRSVILSTYRYIQSFGGYTLWYIQTKILKSNISIYVHNSPVRIDKVIIFYT